MSEKTKKAGAPSCGLWLRLGPDLELEMLLRDLKQIFFVINGSAYEKNMHTLELCCNEDSADEKEKAAQLIEMAKQNGIAAIWRGDAKTAGEVKADGVLLDDVENVKQAKELFGQDGIIGLACGLSDEAAAAAFDAEVDFVSFGTGKATMPDAKVLTFWTMLTDLPAVIEGDVTNDYAAYYVNQGAGFIDCKSYIWGHEKGVMQGTVNMLHAIDTALENNKKQAQ